MTHVSSSGSYIRKNAAAHSRSLQSARRHFSSIDEKVWELLETPQTIESLRRAAGCDTQSDREHIQQSMERLLDADLIELSPDS